MIQTIQKLFHTDRWWGKTMFIVFVYAVYWCVFYGSWLVFPDQHPADNTDAGSNLFLVYLLGIVPLLSFFIPPFIKKVFTINKTGLYVMHIILIILCAAIFMTIAITSALSNIQIG